VDGKIKSVRSSSGRTCTGRTILRPGTKNTGSSAKGQHGLSAAAGGSPPDALSAGGSVSSDTPRAPASIPVAVSGIFGKRGRRVGWGVQMALESAAPTWELYSARNAMPVRDCMNCCRAAMSAGAGRKAATVRRTLKKFAFTQLDCLMCEPSQA
jgi:hypothetical protein